MTIDIPSLVLGRSTFKLRISSKMARFTEKFFSLIGLQAKADGSSPSADSKGEGYPKKCKCTKCENCGSGAEADTGICKYCKDNCVQK
ncbi:hypothetical protein DL770_010487 [Monosporascus sp. CRB-9-2]|nr:hypothetical protein DL770_010487 [Monosporascus sp. CRB-9-2]